MAGLHCRAKGSGGEREDGQRSVLEGAPAGRNHFFIRSFNKHHRAPPGASQWASEGERGMGGPTQLVKTLMQLHPTTHLAQKIYPYIKQEIKSCSSSPPS